MKEKLIQRYTPLERINHWVVVTCFLLLAISGLGFFFPSFFWLTHIFGTPQLARMLHPFFGIVMFIGFAIMFVRYFSSNFINKEDIKWGSKILDVLRNRHVHADIGKYNIGQKMLFWSLGTLMVVLLITGFVVWRRYFSDYFPIPVIRVALLFHALAGIGIIVAIMVHIYAAIWIRGSIRAMTDGVVPETWASKHHPKWYREIMAKKAEAQKNEASNA